MITESKNKRSKKERAEFEAKRDAKKQHKEILKSRYGIGAESKHFGR